MEIAGAERSPQEEEKDSLSPKQVARRLGIGRTKTYTMLVNQEIPNFKVGRVRKVRPEDLEKYIERQLEAAKN